VDFRLLGDARHDGDIVDVLRINALRLGKVGLDDGAHHHVRTLGCGQVVQQLRMLVLHIADPARRAAGQLRELAALGDTADEFIAFLHDREVGAEVGVIDAVEADSAQRRCHLAGDSGADRHAELFAQGSTDGRSGLYDHELVGIIQRHDDIVDVLALMQSADRAVQNALAALHAVDVREAAVVDRTDDGLEAAVDVAENAQSLDLLAGIDAASAQHALRGVADNAPAHGIKRRLGVLAFKLVLADARLFAELLQLAVLVAYAGQAVLVVVRHDEFQRVSSALQDSGGIGKYFHALADRSGAGRQQRSGLLHFDQADAAGAGLCDSAQIAERRNMDSIGSCGFQNSCSRFDSDGSVIDL